MNIEPEDNSFKNKSGFSIILVLLVVSLAANIYLGSKVAGSASEYDKVVQENEELKAQAENRVKKLNETVQELRNENADINKKLSSVEVQLDFYKDNAVFVTRTGDCYHRLMCPSISGKEYWIYNIENAEVMGFRPCEICFMDNIA